MLLKTKITSIEINTDAWQAARLGKITASNVHKLMGDKGIGQTGLTYIRERVGEEITGVSAQRDVSTFSIEWGFQYENEGLNKWGLSKGIEFLITQKLIVEPGTRFSCTPDALWIKSESKDGLSYEVSTGEIKCFQLAHHIEMCECLTPAEIKKADPKVYWQVLDQMLICDALTGYAIFYHPEMRFANLHSVEFKRIDNAIRLDIHALKGRKDQAVILFDEIFNRLLPHDNPI